MAVAGALPGLRARLDWFGAVRALTLVESGVARALGDMRAAHRRALASLWSERALAPLVLDVTDATADTDGAEALDRMLRAEQASQARLWLELREAGGGTPAALLGAAVRLRAAGWRLSLRLAWEARIPLEPRTRAVFDEIVAPAGMAPDRRISAARSAGFIATATLRRMQGRVPEGFDQVEAALVERADTASEPAPHEAARHDRGARAPAPAWPNGELAAHDAWMVE